jgi:hypothetical protein
MIVVVLEPLATTATTPDPTAAPIRAATMAVPAGPRQRDGRRSGGGKTGGVAPPYGADAGGGG